MIIAAWLCQFRRQKHAVKFEPRAGKVDKATLSKQRLEWLDAIRGVAVVLMVVFHFAYDLSYFGWYDEDVSGGATWRPLGNTIMGLFICSMVLGLNLVHGEKRQFKRYLRWLARVFPAAILISIATYFLYPGTWVYFGILHFMVFSSVVVLLLMPFKRLSAALGIMIFAIYLFDYLPYGWPLTYIRFLFHDGISVDYVPIFPWLGLALITHAYARYILSFQFVSIFSTLTPRFIRLLGRHSLGIYLVHQPVLFGLLYLFSNRIKYLELLDGIY